jgi:hypothetical protein
VAAALEGLSALIEVASGLGSFGLAQSSAEGKALVRVLVLAAVTTKHGSDALQPHGAPNAHGSRGPPTLHAISTRLSPLSAPRAGPSTRCRS